MRFLTETEIERIHADQIRRYGGKTGLRDRKLLLSALAQPQVVFGGVEANPSSYDKAAAYLFHLCNNHPFTDGNKRVGLVAALLFLKLNGYSILYEPADLEAMVFGVASGKIVKGRVAEFLSGNFGP